MHEKDLTSLPVNISPHIPPTLLFNLPFVKWSYYTLTIYCSPPNKAVSRYVAMHEKDFISLTVNISPHIPPTLPFNLPFVKWSYCTFIIYCSPPNKAISRYVVMHEKDLTSLPVNISPHIPPTLPLNLSFVKRPAVRSFWLMSVRLFVILFHFMYLLLTAVIRPSHYIIGEYWYTSVLHLHKTQVF